MIRDIKILEQKFKETPDPLIKTICEGIPYHSPERSSGNTTRLVDFFVQQFFTKNSCKVYDHQENRDSQKRILKIVHKRLTGEHNLVYGEDFTVDTNKFLITRLVQEGLILNEDGEEVQEENRHGLVSQLPEPMSYDEIRPLTLGSLTSEEHTERVKTLMNDGGYVYDGEIKEPMSKGAVEFKEKYYSDMKTYGALSEEYRVKSLEEGPSMEDEYKEARERAARIMSKKTFE